METREKEGSVVGFELERMMRHPDLSNERYLYHQGNLYKRGDRNDATLVNSMLPLIDWYDLVTVAINPRNENEIWIAFGPHGLYHSIDGGRGFEVLLSVSIAEKAKYVALSGVPLVESGLVLTGKLRDGRRGTFYSIDGGSIWTEVPSVEQKEQPKVRRNWRVTLAA